MWVGCKPPLDAVAPGYRARYSQHLSVWCCHPLKDCNGCLAQGHARVLPDGSGASPHPWGKGSAPKVEVVVVAQKGS